jgi:hypothetical protein
MNHDIQAAWASSEIATLINTNQISFFDTLGTIGGWSVYAGREGGRQWPLADGVIIGENATSVDVKMALEFKRPNEGVHGILTALGQALAYLEKGYDASFMVIPERYTSHSSPGPHLKRILDAIAPTSPISIYTYDTPDSSATRPFYGKLHCVRDIVLPRCSKISSTSFVSTGNVTTLWAHIREGMSHPNAFYRYCQGIKSISATRIEDLSDIIIPKELEQAVKRIAPTIDIYKYLSNTSGDNISDKAWRSAWFRYYFWNELMPIYSSSSPYVVNDMTTKLKTMYPINQGLFSGRSDSIKNKLVDELNLGMITENTAWEKYAIKVRKDAHSYREVIDSGLFHIGFIDENGNLSELGYKYVDACEKIDDANTGIPLEILRAAVLQNGQYGAFLHYVYQISEEKFARNPLAFTTKSPSGKFIFNQTVYKEWLYNVFANDLHLIAKSTVRAGGTRNPFQAEIPLLKQLGFIKETTPTAPSFKTRPKYRIGVGFEIDWPQVQNSMMYSLTL